MHMTRKETLLLGERLVKVLRMPVKFLLQIWQCYTVSARNKCILHQLFFSSFFLPSNFLVPFVYVHKGFIYEESEHSKSMNM